MEGALVAESSKAALEDAERDAPHEASPLVAHTVPCFVCSKHVDVRLAEPWVHDTEELQASLCPDCTREARSLWSRSPWHPGAKQRRQRGGDPSTRRERIERVASDMTPWIYFQPSCVIL